MIDQAALDYDQLVVLAILAVLLVSLFFLFRSIPWRRRGSWRRIWIVSAVAIAMFILSEAVTLASTAMAALDTLHQVPLFGALMAAATALFLVYTDGYRASERARILALTDAITELPNRRAFEERLKVAFERAEAFSLLYMDLDGFKQVNDRLGHAAGDDVLRRTAAVLRQCIRQADIAARLGGDEFCLLLSGAEIETTRVVAERVLAGLLAISLPQGLTVGASFGIATRRDGSDPREVLGAADAAMYRVKHRPGDRIAVAGSLERAEARARA